MRLAAGVLVGVLAIPALAQDGQPQQIDPGYGDASPGAISLRRLDLDLRMPTAFQDVYKISTIDAFGVSRNTFMRTDGAVTAIFPRSVYLPSPMGSVPDVPPGTVFHIGPLPQASGPVRFASSTFLDFSVNSAPLPEPVLARPVVGVGSLITDELYRQRRIEALLTFALQR